VAYQLAMLLLLLLDYFIHLPYFCLHWKWCSFLRP